MKPPWTKHSQTRSKQLAEGNKSAPAFLRIAWYAMGHCKANRHCELKRGFLAKFLAVGENKRYRYVDASIAKAVDYGLLDASSQSTCLVVSALLADGPPGDDDADCVTHMIGKGGANWAKCHPDKPRHAGGLCNSCYQADRRQKAALSRILSK